MTRGNLIMRRFTCFILVLPLLFFIFGCQRSEGINQDPAIQNDVVQKSVEQEESSEKPQLVNQGEIPEKISIYDSSPSIGGVSIGELSGKVEYILGYPDEEMIEQGGYYGEPIQIWHYGNGTELILGKKTERVLEISTVSVDMETNLGVQINDNAGEALVALRQEFQEHQGLYSHEPLIGWFELGKGELLIINFDAAKMDNKINAVVGDEDVVERITLTSEWFYE
ncbi:MAG: hypothetical protein U9N81_07035 [Bacillota bacterium]|nr:hypothetical protein [Bacillota bacterium]